MVFFALALAICCAEGQAEPARVVGAASVSGRLLSHDGKPLTSALVIMSPQAGERVPERTVGEVRIKPDGSFTFGNVPAGRYVIRARGETAPNGTSLFAVFGVAVRGRDVTHIEMTLAPGASVLGRAAFKSVHGAASPPLASLRIRAPLMDGSSFGDSVTGAVRADGGFRLAGLMAGLHVLVADGLPFPWRISEATLQGRDVVAQPFAIDSDKEYRDLALVLTDTASGVSGNVSIPEGVSADRVLVIVVPADASKRAMPLRFVRAGRVRADGTYRIIDLPPGEYRVVAAQNLEEVDAWNEATLERLAAASVPVTLIEAQVATLALQVKSAPPSALP